MPLINTISPISTSFHDRNTLTKLFDEYKLAENNNYRSNN